MLGGQLHMTKKSPTRVTLVVDPRFPGGTSTAVASEILTIAPVVNLRVATFESKMFKGTSIHPAIDDACDVTGTPIDINPALVSAEVVIFHNPSCLKFNEVFLQRIVCDRLFVVCHENFYRPTGGENFDIEKCLSLLRNATLARQMFLAPVSGWNRLGLTEWNNKGNAIWEITDINWNNICEFDVNSPTHSPRDRRGRHSRPGFEKFPDLSTLELLFPSTCESVRILGAESLMEETTPEMWELLPFGGESVDAFLKSIDFFVYFTNPTCRESFGRVIAEAISAGKLVITDHGTGATFGAGVIQAEADEVDEIIRAFIASPTDYCQHVESAQLALNAFSAASFLEQFNSLLRSTARETQLEKNQLEAIHAFV